MVYILYLQYIQLLLLLKFIRSRTTGPLSPGKGTDRCKCKHGGGGKGGRSPREQVGHPRRRSNDSCQALSTATSTQPESSVSSILTVCRHKPSRQRTRGSVRHDSRLGEGYQTVGAPGSQDGGCKGIEYTLSTRCRKGYAPTPHQVQDQTRSPRKECTLHVQSFTHFQKIISLQSISFIQRSTPSKAALPGKTTRIRRARVWLVTPTAFNFAVTASL